MLIVMLVVKSNLVGGTWYTDYMLAHFLGLLINIVSLLKREFIVTSHCDNRRYKGNNFHTNLGFFFK